MNDPGKTARTAGLKYISDEAPGIKRLKHGKRFTYRDSKGQAIKDSKTLDRIKALVIPPAWEDVWISPHAEGHLQATGRDKRNRKQYRYHDRWTVKRNETKFEHLADLCHKLPVLRQRVEQDLQRAGMPQEKVLAAIIKLMLLTQARVGNAEYAEQNNSFGLTTIRNHHAKVRGAKVKLNFRGKSGVDHAIDLEDPGLAKIIRHCQELPGQELFAYRDTHGRVIDVTSTQVNNYLKEVTGEDFTAKDLRTLGGTCKALSTLVEMGPETKLSESKLAKRQLAVIRETSAFLRNTVAVCRKYYIHPCVFAADQKGRLTKLWQKYSRAHKHVSREELILAELLKA